MSSSHPPPTTPRYKRPELPPPTALRERTASLREKNDALAASLGEPPTSVRPRGPALAPGQLAPTIRAQNEARVERAWSEEQENARQELLLACGLIRDSVDHTKAGGSVEALADSVEMFVFGVQEFLAALVAKGEIRRADALRSMRESVAAMDRYRTEGR